MPAGMTPGVLGLGAIGVLGIIVFLIALFVAGLFLYFGAKIVGIEDATIGKSMIAVLGGGILEAILSIVPVIGWLLGIIGYIWVIKAVFNTTWLKAFLAWIMTIVVVIITAFVLGAIIGLSISAVP
ncbi:hypothetical protein [Thermococcus gammatolerans]|uniref:Yip1 domain-containing protein n=1 Tax=Thermococcus gammatolerans (strain DSM 15229 / JCM 11827 / EJ3) TaxID=593117 RepID=C5A6E7_THEGJ|nr:hypothetical protein [Thermococcus gammatolerans]ACS33809.1 Conserved hypothetical protein [Thermococcus gammatolerans EJ3]